LGAGNTSSESAKRRTDRPCQEPTDSRPAQYTGDGVLTANDFALTR
jgi:hypothetical protein